MREVWYRIVGDMILTLVREALLRRDSRWRYWLRIEGSELTFPIKPFNSLEMR
jgi:hypothetical protein